MGAIFERFFDCDISALLAEFLEFCVFPWTDGFGWIMAVNDTHV